MATNPQAAETLATKTKRCARQSLDITDAERSRVRRTMAS